VLGERIDDHRRLTLLAGVGIETDACGDSTGTLGKLA
jgi:hypothetical protein